jgi:hypothetical protein
MPSSGAAAPIGIRGLANGGDGEHGRGAESSAALCRGCSFTDGVTVQFCLWVTLLESVLFKVRVHKRISVAGLDSFKCSTLEYKRVL